MHSAPIVALSMITAFMPISALRPMRAPCTIAPWPMCAARLEHHRHAGEHVDGAVLLHVAAVLDDDAAPVAANRRARPDVHVAADDDVAGDRRVRMHERRLVHDRNESVELVDAIERQYARRSCVTRAR